MKSTSYIREKGIPEWTDRLLAEVVNAQPTDVTLFGATVLGKWLLQSTEPNSLIDTAITFTEVAINSLRKIKHTLATSGEAAEGLPMGQPAVDKLLQLQFLCEGLKGVITETLPIATARQSWAQLSGAVELGRACIDGTVTIPPNPPRKQLITQVYKELSDVLTKQFPEKCSVLVTDRDARVVWSNGYFLTHLKRPLTLDTCLERYGGDSQPLQGGTATADRMFKERNRAMFYALHCGGQLCWQLSPPSCSEEGGEKEGTATVYCSNYFPYVTTTGTPLVIGVARIETSITTISAKNWHLAQTFDCTPGFTTLYSLNDFKVVLQNYASALMMVSFTGQLFTSNLGTMTFKAQADLPCDNQCKANRFLPHLEIDAQTRSSMVDDLLSGKPIVGFRANVNQQATAALADPDKTPTTTAKQTCHIINARVVHMPMEHCTKGKFIIVNELDITDQVGMQENLQAALDIAKHEQAKASKEQQRTTTLMRQILPVDIINRLCSQESKLISDTYHNVSLLFADIAGFTAWSSTVTADQVVRVLHLLISHVDDVADALGVEKIKTIGDCYFAVTGCPTVTEDHADRMLQFAFRLLQICTTYLSCESLDMRVGIHSGEVVAGVIGKHKFAFDLWGDAVNTASRMESTGVPGRVQISEATRNLITSGDCFSFEERFVSAKGKGTMKAYLASVADPEYEKNCDDVRRSSSLSGSLPWAKISGTPGASSVNSDLFATFDVDISSDNPNFYIE